MVKQYLVGLVIKLAHVLALMGYLVDILLLVNTYVWSFQSRISAPHVPLS